MALAPEKPAALTVSDRWDGRVATVTVRGEIDISTAGILSGRLDDLASQDPERLVIDLAEVGFMDSSGMCLDAIGRGHPAARRNCRMAKRRREGVSCEVPVNDQARSLGEPALMMILIRRRLSPAVFVRPRARWRFRYLGFAVPQLIVDPPIAGEPAL